MALVPDRMSQLLDLTDVMRHNCGKIDDLLNDFRNGSQLNENDLNVSIKSEVKQESSIKKENEDEVGESSNPSAASATDTKPATRQLRSKRSTTQMTVNYKEDPSAIQNSTKTNGQFEISFQKVSGDIDNSKLSISNIILISIPFKEA